MTGASDSQSVETLKSFAFPGLIEHLLLRGRSIRFGLARSVRLLDAGFLLVRTVYLGYAIDQRFIVDSFARH